jgi:hypothetical protein
MNMAAVFEEMLESRPNVLAYIDAGSEMNWGQVAHMGHELRKQLADVPDGATIGILCMRARRLQLPSYACSWPAVPHEPPGKAEHDDLQDGGRNTACLRPRRCR